MTDPFDTALIESARQAIAAQPGVVGVIDGSAPGEFIVLTFEQTPTGDQAMTLEQWTATGPTGQLPGEFTIAFRPAHLEALAYMLTEARKILDANGMLARPGGLAS